MYLFAFYLLDFNEWLFFSPIALSAIPSKRSLKIKNLNAPIFTETFLDPFNHLFQFSVMVLYVCCSSSTCIFTQLPSMLDELLIESPVLVESFLLQDIRN